MNNPFGLIAYGFMPDTFILTVGFAWEFKGPKKWLGLKIQFINFYINFIAGIHKKEKE